jgi:hypothetical protein
MEKQRQPSQELKLTVSGLSPMIPPVEMIQR